MNTNCKAREPEHCRYHGTANSAYKSLEHAKHLHDREKERLTKIDPSDKTRYEHRVEQVEITKNMVEQAETVYDSLDESYRQLKDHLNAAKKELNFEAATILQKRLENADQLRQHRVILQKAGLKEPVISFTAFDVNLKNRVEKAYQKVMASASVLSDDGGVTVTLNQLFGKTKILGLIHKENSDPFYFEVTETKEIKELNSGKDYQILVSSYQGTTGDYC